MTTQTNFRNLPTKTALRLTYAAKDQGAEAVFTTFDGDKYWMTIDGINEFGPDDAWELRVLVSSRYIHRGIGGCRSRQENFRIPISRTVTIPCLFNEASMESID